MACDTWQLMLDRHAWDGEGLAQIDFIWVSQDGLLRDAWVDQHIYSAKDHRPTIAEVERQLEGGEW